MSIDGDIVLTNSDQKQWQVALRRPRAAIGHDDDDWFARDRETVSVKRGELGARRSGRKEL